MATLLSRDAILGASDIKTEDVPVPEWGGTVRVKGLTAAQRDKAEEAMLSMRGGSKDMNVSINMAGVRALMASMAIVDEDNKPIFTHADVKALGEKSGIALDRVFEAVTRLSGIGDNDIEELTGNSEPGQNEGSLSD